MASSVPGGGSLHSMHRILFATLLSVATPVLSGQKVVVRGTDQNVLPAIVDSNSPVLWRDGRFHIYTSAGTPMVSIGDSQYGPFETRQVGLDTEDHFPMWIESVWPDEDGKVFAWYHHERIGVCPGSELTAPRIGALVSTDGGKSFRDLGIVLDSGEIVNCSAQNGYFAGGHGDFSVIPDREGQFLYFFFGVYDGDAPSQGVAVARMAIEDRFLPVGAVRKFFRGAWQESGLGGRATPIFSAQVGWEQRDTDSFWGPSLHWNTHLKSYVMLLNRSCCRPGWPQEGIYISFNANLADPVGWKDPERLLESGSWYPQVIGAGPLETEATVGREARLYLWGSSDLELVFLKDGEAESAEPEIPAVSIFTSSRNGSAGTPVSSRFSRRFTVRPGSVSKPLPSFEALGK